MQAEQANTNTKESRARRRRRKRVRRVIWRIVLSLLTVVALLLLATLGACYAAFRGPSRSIADKLTMTLLETSALKFVPHLLQRG